MWTLRLRCGWRTRAHAVALAAHSLLDGCSDTKRLPHSPTTVGYLRTVILLPDLQLVDITGTPLPLTDVGPPTHYICPSCYAPVVTFDCTYAARGTPVFTPLRLRTLLFPGGFPLRLVGYRDVVITILRSCVDHPATRYVGCCRFPVVYVVVEPVVVTVVDLVPYVERSRPLVTVPHSAPRDLPFQLVVRAPRCCCGLFDLPLPRFLRLLFITLLILPVHCPSRCCCCCCRLPVTRFTAGLRLPRFTPTAALVVTVTVGRYSRLRYPT